MLPFHAYAEIFPLIVDAERAELVADIKANGLHQKIKLFDGEILDGRNRYLAAIDAGLFDKDDPVTPGTDTAIKYFSKFMPARDGDPLAFVLSCNLHRRHLNESQRGMIGARIANLGVGRPPSPSAETPSIEGISQERAAKMVNVGVATIGRGAAVLRGGAEELVNAVDRGESRISAAAELAKLPLSEQAMILRGADKRALGAVVKELRDEKTEAKKLARTEKERALGERIVAETRRLGGDGKRYGVILADPPWRFEPRSRETGMDRSPDNHYPTMTLSEILALPRPAAEDCALFLWATAPMLLEALRVMECWGFAYRSNCIWAKKGFLGTGYWWRSAHEQLLLGVRGEVPAPAMGTQFPSVIEAEPGAHSAKPECFRVMIEAMFPTLPRIEMFARSGRPGWETWGAEAPGSAGILPALPCGAA